MKNKTIIVFGALLVILIAACNDIEKKVMNASEAQTLLIESVTAYSIFAGTQEEATVRSGNVESLYAKSGTESAEYPLISIEPLDLTSWPKTITVDYGPDNFEGWDGVLRRGTMVIEATNFPSVTGAEWQVTFDDFYHNDYKVEGTQTITYKGLNEAQNHYYQCKVSDGIITSPAGRSFYFEQNTFRERISGTETPLNICDDEYLISGSHNGVSSDGYVYEMTTPQELHIRICCPWVMEGRLAVALPDNDLDCEINYRPEGDTGDCNNKASFTIFGENVDITLP